MVTHTRFEDPRLTPQENKACEMLFNGFSREDIEDELDISRLHLCQLFAKARRKGVAVPKDKPLARTGPGAPRCSTERLLQLKAQLGSITLISERIGVSRVAVWRRLRDAA